MNKTIFKITQNAKHPHFINKSLISKLDRQ